MALLRMDVLSPKIATAVNSEMKIYQLFFYGLLSHTYQHCLGIPLQRTIAQRASVSKLALPLPNPMV